MSCAPFMQWKEEPLSPLYTEEVAWLSEDTFYQTSPDHHNNDDLDVDNVTFKLEDRDMVPCETKAEAASIMLENLENLINLDELIKEEPFLLDEKILPILDDVDHHQPRAIEVPLVASSKMEFTSPLPSPDATQFLLQEFENVYDVVELAHGTLTPPQSPPGDQKILTTLEPLLQPPGYAPDKPYHIYAAVPEKPLLAELAAPDYPSAATPQPDIAQALAVVDELVRTRVEDMQWSSGPSSPNSSTSSGSSSFGDCSSDDPEWTPEPVESYEGEGVVCPGAAKPTRKRSKPYSRSNGSTDKKSRKKEQNKNAATRYRMKKKAEVEVILGEEKGLSEQNEGLEEKIRDMQREIKYLKGLMRDLFKAKGLIN